MKKKLLSMLAAVTLLLASASTVFADGSDEIITGGASHDFVGQTVDETDVSNAPDTVIGFKVTWTSDPIVTVTRTNKTQYLWNPATLAYDIQKEGTGYEYSFQLCNFGAKVTNYSNVDVKIRMSVNIGVLSLNGFNGEADNGVFVLPSEVLGEAKAASSGTVGGTSTLTAPMVSLSPTQEKLESLYNAIVEAKADSNPSNDSIANVHITVSPKQ